MRPVAIFCLLASVQLQAGPRDISPSLPVTVLLDFVEASPSVSLTKIKKTFDRVFANSPIQVEVKLKSAVQSESQNGELLVFTMKGRCIAEALPVGALPDDRGALAMAYTTDGTILPFGEVRCDKLRASLERMYGRGQLPAHSAALELAIAHVLAHEIYHMLASSAAHTKTGVTKQSLSPQDLVSSDLLIPAGANEALRKAIFNTSSHPVSISDTILPK